jgi:hypothetical protein
MQTAISPVAVYPATANTLYIRSIGLGPPPSYYYELQDVQVVEKTREVPNPNYVAQNIGLDGQPLPAPEPKVALDGTPIDTTSQFLTETYEETTVAVLKNGNVNMTIDQWDNWAAGPATGDDDYQLDCIALNLGLVRA